MRSAWATGPGTPVPGSSSLHEASAARRSATTAAAPSVSRPPSRARASAPRARASAPSARSRSLGAPSA
ncbi:Uncharacterised protein [Mycobacteroides abscessus]|nr:Uncharacterised protein [Mycobacteroides abscessus]